MLRGKTFVCVVALCALAVGVAGCGREGLAPGFGSFSLTSVVPGSVPAMIPTTVTINGGDWTNLVGVPVEVTYVADGGFTPFSGGTAGSVSVPGTITSPTTISTITPPVTICGPASITAAIRVTMGSGVTEISAPFFITFLAPTITSVANTGGVLAGSLFDAAVPEPATITGANFGDVGASVDVYWRSTPAGGGPLLFNAGSSMTTKTTGTVVSATTVTTTSPLALVCGPAIVSQPAEIFRIEFRDGSCTPTAGPFAPCTFRAPTITGIVNNTARAIDAGTSQFAAAIPNEPFTVTGTGYGPVGGTALVTFTSATATAIWNNGFSTAVTVPCMIVSRTTITGASPPALLCAPALASDAQNVTAEMPDGACTPAPTAATVFAPAFAAVTPIQNTAAGSPYLGLNDFAAALPEAFLITGTRFGGPGSTAMVTFTSANTFFQGGTSTTTTVLGDVTSSTTIIGVSPPAAICGPALNANGQVIGPATDVAQVLVTCDGGSCTPTTVPADFFPPVITGPNTNISGRVTPIAFSQFFGHIPEQMRITGTDFGPIGGTAQVTFFETLAGQTPFTPIGGGANVALSTPVLATITSRTTMELLSPLGNYTSAAGNAGLVLTGGTFTSQRGDPDIAAQFEGGSCTPTPFNDFALFSSVRNLTPAATVVSTIPLGQAAMPAIAVTGQGFWPIGGTAQITLQNPVPATPGFPVTVTGTIVSETMITATLPVIAPRLTADVVVDLDVRLTPFGTVGTNSFGTATHTLSAPPTITTITNASAGAAAPSFLTTIPGTDYIPCHNSTMSIVGTGFDIAGAPSESVLSIYDLNSGVGPAPGVVPVRPLGTATPAGNDLGDAALYTTNLTTTTISARVRLEGRLDDLDTDRNGLVTARVRVVNADGQFHETGAAAPLDPVYRTTSPALNVGSGFGTDQVNTSVAIDPSSFTDDFGSPTGANDLVTPGINMAVAASLDDPGIGFGFFLATDALVSTSQDGGGTWTVAAAGLAALEGAPLPPPVGDEIRNFFHVVYDRFGTLWMCYLRTAPTAGQDDIVLVNSIDNGATWTFAPGVVASTAALAPFGAGLLSAPHMAGGSYGTTILNDVVAITWVDRTATLGLGFSDVVRVWGNYPLGLGSVNAFPGAINVSDPNVAPPGFFLLDPKVAIGPNGETYVAWQEPDAFFANITFRIDVDRDGMAVGTFAFNPGPDLAISTTPLPAVGLPSQPDIGFLPLCDVAVAQAGSDAGRVVFAYDRIIPLAGPGTRDHAQVVTHVSDTFGSTWSAAVVPHATDQNDRFIPAIASDRITGRLHVSWYDTTPTGGAVGTHTAFDRRVAASGNGVNWGADRNMFNGRAAATHALNLNNDHALFADIVSHNGCVLAGWGDPGDTGGATNDPVVTVFSQNDK